MQKKFSIILACDDRRGIAKSVGPNKSAVIPWKFSDDLKYFRAITTGKPHRDKHIDKKNAVIMGRKTYESIGKVLPDRINIVISRTLPEYSAGKSGESGQPPLIIKPDLNSALAYCSRKPEVLDVFVIGGSQLYADAIYHPLCSAIFITRFHYDFECDMFFPALSSDYEKADEYCASLTTLDNQANENGKTEEKCNNISAESRPSSTYMHKFTIPVTENTTRIQEITISVTYEKYIRPNKSELAYLNLLAELVNSPATDNRTAVKTRRMFAQTLKYPLSLIIPGDNRANIPHVEYIAGNTIPILPLFTSKKVSFITVYRELLWFLRGGVDARELQKNNVTIWDGNSSREFLDSRGLDYYRKGELGPIYGWQWRHFGAQYIPLKTLEEMGFTSHDEYFAGNADKGIDQIAELIAGIKSDPYSRRHVICAWNPRDLGQMALPPCHFSAVFYVESGIKMQKKRVGRVWTLEPCECPRFLSCCVTMRSNDMFLGHPFNVASYALLTHMIAAVCGLEAKELAITSVDSHLYDNHCSAAREQIARKDNVCGYPRLRFAPEIMKKINHSAGNQLNIADFSDNSIEICDYFPLPPIKAKMVA